jgi:hypothetical protein
VQLPAPTASTDVSAIAAMVRNEDSLFFCAAGALVDVSCETLFLLTNKQQRSTFKLNPLSVRWSSTPFFKFFFGN